jgi:hypothetical protein
MGFFKNLFFGKELSDVLSETKTVRANGIRFKIKRLNVTNHLEGLNCLIETYATYERKKEIEKAIPPTDQDATIEKVKKAYSDIFLASVVHPKLTAKKDSPGQYVGDLFDDWEMCHSLYEQIMIYTNKKKIKKHTSLNPSYMNSI